MTYEISEAPPEIFAELKSILREQFGFDTFAEPIEGPDQTVGTCSNGKVTLEWGHASYSGFHFFQHQRSRRKARRRDRRIHQRTTAAATVQFLPHVPDVRRGVKLNANQNE
jgi:hypothetical protein